MAEFEPIVAPEREDATNYLDLFDPVQFKNWTIGATRAKHGVEQAVTEIKEALGLVPEGTTEFVTQEMKQDEKVLRDVSKDAKDLTGAGFVQFAGEFAPLAVVPFGGSVRAAGALGGLASSTFFHDDPAKRSRLVDSGIGAGLGAVTFAGGSLLRQALVSGGPAREQAKHGLSLFERNLERAQQPALPAPARYLALENRSAPRLPAPAPKARDPRASLKERGFTADDFQLAGRDPIPGFQGVPKPRLRQQLSSARQALDARELGKYAAAALRKAEVFARNAARKAVRLEESLGKARARGAKTHIVAKRGQQAAKAKADKVAGNIFLRSLREIMDGTRSAKPVVRAPAAKPHIKGPAARSKDSIVAKEVQAVKDVMENGTIKDMRAMLKTAGIPINSKWKKSDYAKTLRALADDLENPATRGAGKVPGKQGGFVTESTPLNAITGAGVGGAVGGSVSDGDPAAIALGALTGGIGGLATSRALDRYITNAQRKGMRETGKRAAEVNREVSRAVKAKDWSSETIAKILINGRNALDEFLGSTMTRLEILVPRVAVALKQTEFQQHYQAGQWIARGDDIFARIKNTGLDDAQRDRFEILLMNSTDSAKKYLRGLGKNDAADAVAEMEDILGEAGQYLKGVDLGDSLRKNYFPRMVVDTSYFEKIPEVRNYLEQLAHKKGVSLSEFEKEIALTNVINGALTRGPDQVHFARAAANLQKRTIKVTGKNRDAYAHPQEAFNDYIESITMQAERRRFFKGLGVKVDDLGPNAENIESVAARLRKSLEAGDLTPDQLDEVAQLIRMRFGPGEQAPSKWVQNFKNLTYGGLLGNPLAAATQFGDIALSAHRNGIRNTAVAVVDNLSRRGKPFRELDKETLLGIRNAASDFASKTGTRDLLNWSLKYSGFQAVDRLGKNTFIQAAMRKNQKLSLDEFKQRWGKIFDPDSMDGATPRTDALYNQVQEFDGLTKANKEDIGFMLWNELEGVQPIALSALPERYLRHPDGRMAYMLQSFTLKLFDVMRKDIYDAARAGNYKQAARKAVRLSSLFVAMNGGVDSTKNFMLGREQTVPDVVMNNYLKLLGMNKYTMGQIETQGFGKAALQQIAPPTVLLDAVTDPKEALKLAPPFGKLIESRIPEE